MIQENTTIGNGVSQIPQANPLPDQNSAPTSGTLEAVFASAIREAVSPMVQRWVKSHQEEITSALGLIVQRWMDERLPKVVESGLIEELRRPSARRARC